ncbi:MAG: type II secretion system protein [Pseudomonadota bacterium]
MNTTLKNGHHQIGFSLIEMAMVLMIIGTLMGGVLVAVSQTTENARRSTARNQLREVETALYGYAQIHGRLPCPARHDSSGKEVPEGGVNCTSPNGFVPAVTLNLNGAVNTDGLLLDPWQNPLRYSVASTMIPDFTNPSSIRTFFKNGTPLDPTNMLSVCSSTGCTAGTELATTVPAVIISMGADWASYSSAEEQANGGNGSPQLGTYNVTSGDEFVSAQYAEDQFDDQLVWISPYVLFNKMISAGKLP